MQFYYIFIFSLLYHSLVEVMLFFSVCLQCEIKNIFTVCILEYIYISDRINNIL